MASLQLLTALLVVSGLLWSQSNERGALCASVPARLLPGQQSHPALAASVSEPALVDAQATDLVCEDPESGRSGSPVAQELASWLATDFASVLEQLATKTRDLANGARGPPATTSRPVSAPSTASPADLA